MQFSTRNFGKIKIKTKKEKQFDFCFVKKTKKQKNSGYIPGKDIPLRR